MSDWIDYMIMAVEEAEQSLRLGNSGFGAVVVKDGAVIGKAGDSDKTDSDPTAHAELKAIRQAASRIGRDLAGCGIITTHEPCPMCSAAILWSGIDHICYGYSIEEAVQQGRKRIPMPCGEIFDRAGKIVTIEKGILHDHCSVLYDRDVREQIDRLRNADLPDLCRLAEEIKVKRIAWVHAHRYEIEQDKGPLLDTAYRLILRKLGIPQEQAPVVERRPERLTFQSRNFCPTLEACKILKLDTRYVCKHLTDMPTNALLQALDSRLRFSRNYVTLRPHGDCCEETISI